MSRAVTWGYEGGNMVIMVHPHLEEEKLHQHHEGKYKLLRMRYNKKQQGYYFAQHKAEVKTKD
ncbi:hypothetical protein [Priestia flexa]|uniref:hypothetical protein n=1 Tax=Priestia flexa TaxID=86664 RepID=UPI001F4CBF7C|nr:hypothetical protein [Priestia flexa]